MSNEERYKAALEEIRAFKPIKPRFLNDPDFCLFDYTGSNIDDAYAVGVESGLWDAAEVAIKALEDGK